MKFDPTRLMDYYNGLNVQTRYALLGLMVIVVILADLCFGVMPQIRGIWALKEQEGQVSASMEDVLINRPRIDRFKENLERMRAQLKDFQLRLPSVDEMSSVLDLIARTASASGLAIDQMDPHKNQQEFLKIMTGRKYCVLPIAFKAHGSYTMCGRFLNRLEKENVYWWIKDFVIERENQQTSMETLSMTIKIVLVA